MKIMYINTENSGISGDMFLAALLNLVPNPDELLKKLNNLNKYIEGVKKLNIQLRKVERNGILCSHLDISLDETKKHRSIKKLRNALERFLEEHEYSQKAKSYASNVLNTLIEAEAKVHGTTKQKVHLHELSSIDTLIDILGVTLCLDTLNVFNTDFGIFCSQLPLGRGQISSAHGIIPVPAPATSAILENSGIPVKMGPIESELSTPTGVALLKNLSPISDTPGFTLNSTSYSTGTRKFDEFINMFCINLGELQNSKKLNFKKYVEQVSIIETNIDDVSGELIGNFIEKIGGDVLDIQVIPGITKKNRPSYIIKILSKPEDLNKLITEILTEIGTLGIRYYTVNRICIDREIKAINIAIRENNYNVRYKISYINIENQKRIINIKSEYDDLKEIAQKTGHSIKDLKLLIDPLIIEKNKGELYFTKEIQEQK